MTNSHSHSARWNTWRLSQKLASATTSFVFFGFSTSSPNSSPSGRIHESGVIGKKARLRGKTSVLTSSKRTLPLHRSTHTTPSALVALLVRSSFSSAPGLSGSSLTRLAVVGVSAFDRPPTHVSSSAATPSPCCGMRASCCRRVTGIRRTFEPCFGTTRKPDPSA